MSAPTDGRVLTWPLVLRACTLATVLPLWLCPHLPISDLPEHVALMATLRHWWDPAWNGPPTFVLAADQTQYLLYHLLGALLSVPAGSAERANLILLSLSAVAFPYSLRSLLRALGRDERLAIFGCVLFWNQSLIMGFFNSLAATPVVLWVLALVVRQAASPTRRREVAIGGLAVVIYFLHLCAFVYFGLAAFACTVLLPGPLRGWSEIKARIAGLPRRLAWTVPSLFLSLQFLWSSAAIHPERAGGAVGPQGVYFDSLGSAISALGVSLIDIFKNDVDTGCLFALGAACLWMAWPRQRPSESPADTWNRGVVACLILLAALLYVAFPDRVRWFAFLNDRFPIYGALLLPAVLRSAAGAGARARDSVPLVVVAAASMVASANAYVQFRAFEVEAAGFETVMRRATPGRHLLGLTYERESAIVHYSPYLHFVAYYRARGGGVAEASFNTLPHWPLHYRPETTPPNVQYWREGNPESYDDAKEGLYYDYILVRGRPAFQKDSRRWVEAARAGRWTLFEKATD